MTGRDRVAQWTNGLACDTWTLRGNAQRPRDYVAKRMSDISGPGVAPDTGFDAWLEYLESQDVRAIHSGLLVLRRRSDGGWFHMLSAAFTPGEDFGSVIAANMATCDFLELCGDDESLLAATLNVNEDAELHQTSSRDAGTWESRRILVRLARGLPLETEIDLPILAFLNQVDGKQTIGECIARFCELTSADASRLSRELLPAVRMLISSGVLEPAEFVH